MVENKDFYIAARIPCPECYDSVTFEMEIQQLTDTRDYVCQKDKVEGKGFLICRLSSKHQCTIYVKKHCIGNDNLFIKWLDRLWKAMF